VTQTRRFGKRLRAGLLILAVVAVDVVLYVRFGVRDQSTLFSVAALLLLYGWIFIVRE
jgi:hypothetical protein